MAEAKSGDFWKHLFEFLKEWAKLPIWAVLLLVLFGSGGVYYAFQEWREKRATRVTQTQQEERHVGPSLYEIDVTTHFTSHSWTRLPGAVETVVSNNNYHDVPNVTMTTDFGTGNIQECEASSNTAVSAPERMSNNLIRITAPRLAPNQSVRVYCLVYGVSMAKVVVVSADSRGVSRGSKQETFWRQDQSTGPRPGFYSFLQVVAGFVVLAITGIFITLLIKGALKLITVLRW
ncbi:MAG: hypothetical protein L0Z53_18190 [Acidobacteriales bacterium]|nr:hypothetical protein [Terriglobales bacterium]